MTKPARKNDPLFPPTDTLERWNVSSALGRRQALSGDYQNAWIQYRDALRVAESEHLERQVSISQIELAGVLINLGLLEDASGLLAKVLTTPELDHDQERQANEQLSTLFSYAEDWNEALVYKGRARTHIPPGDVTKLFWSHLDQCSLLAKTGNLIGADRELHLARCYAPLDESNRELFGNLVVLCSAELARSRGENVEALRQAQAALKGLEGCLPQQTTALLLCAQILLDDQQHDDVIELLEGLDTNLMRHQDKLEVQTCYINALKAQGRWREASTQLEELLDGHRERKTDAQSAYALQETIEETKQIRLQNQRIAEANESLVASNEQRSQLLELVRKDLQTQLLTTVACWRRLQRSTDLAEREHLLRAAASSVNRLSETAVQVVEMRLTDAPIQPQGIDLR